MSEAKKGITKSCADCDTVLEIPAGPGRPRQRCGPCNAVRRKTQRSPAKRSSRPKPVDPVQLEAESTLQAEPEGTTPVFDEASPVEDTPAVAEQAVAVFDPDSNQNDSPFRY